ncbi:MAG: hypothetical protein R3C44_19040 [Chloroflexota bacterium]
MGRGPIVVGCCCYPSDAAPSGVTSRNRPGVAFLLDEFSLVDANYPVGDGKIHKNWFRLNFPMFYQSDILFALRALADLDALDHPGAQPALDWLAAKRGKNGRWRAAACIGAAPGAR